MHWQYLLTPLTCCYLLQCNLTLITLSHTNYTGIYIINHDMFFYGCKNHLAAQEALFGKRLHGTTTLTFQASLLH